MPDKPMAALAYLEQHDARFLADLKAYVRIPSISRDPAYDDEVRRAAQWSAARLEQAGLTGVEVLETAGHPVVYGQWMQAGPEAPTVLIYGHYDVQKAEPLADWTSDPWEAEVRGENIYGRGTSDMKGQIMASIAAVEAAIQTEAMPLNVKFMLEGEEEAGSDSLPDFLCQQRQRLAADAILNPDAGMPTYGTPGIAYALRGGAVFSLTVRGPARDLHSGMFGGVIQNPIHVLSELIARFHHRDGHINLPGFYDSVRALDAEERALLAKLPMDGQHYLRTSGAPALWGEGDYLPTERVGARPSLDILKIEGGEHKSAIPASATARVAFRLVPDQKPEVVHGQLRQFLQEHMPETVTWELDFLTGRPPVLTGRDSDAVSAMASALRATWDKEPLFYRVGGSIPAMEMCQRLLGTDSVLTGFSLPDDNLHGPNEKLHLPTWRKGMGAFVRFFFALAAS